MKKRLLSLFLAFTLTVSGSITAFAADYTGGNPWIYPDIPGNVTAETNVSLKDDFAVAVNKDYYVTKEIPSGKSRVGVVLENEELLEKQIIGILEDKKNNSPELQDAKLLYNTILNFKERDALGMKPVMPYLEKIQKITTIDELLEYTMKSQLDDQVTLIPIAISEDLEDSTKHMVEIYYPDLVLWDSADYLKPSESSKRVENIYREYFKKLLAKVGADKETAERMVDDFFEFEGMIAGSLYTNEEQSAPDFIDRILNKVTIEEIKATEGTVPLAESMEYLGISNADIINIDAPDYIKKLNEIITEKNLALIKNYLTVGTIYNMAPYLDSECFSLYLLRNQELYGLSEPKALKDYARDLVLDYYPYELGKAYCDATYTKQDKEKVKNVINGIIQEYKLMLMEEDFLSPETKQNALAKLDTLQIRALYPDDWSKYITKFRFSKQNKGNLVAMLNEYSEYKFRESVAELNKPVDKSKWFVGPLEINAFYNPTDNSISILAGFVGHVLYNDEMSTEEIYAKLGSIVGHEISHAFDTSGAQFDKDGNYNNWWTDSDYAEFRKKAEKLDAYYDKIELWKGANVSGVMIDGEAIADMGSIKCLLRMAAKQENFDYDKFFRTYADLWAGKLTPETAEYYYTSDTHPANHLRINVTCAQFEEFYKTYDIKPGDGMYIAPENRVSIW